MKPIASYIYANVHLQALMREAGFEERDYEIEPYRRGEVNGCFLYRVQVGRHSVDVDISGIGVDTPRAVVVNGINLRWARAVDELAALYGNRR